MAPTAEGTTDGEWFPGGPATCCARGRSAFFSPARAVGRSVLLCVLLVVSHRVYVLLYCLCCIVIVIVSYCIVSYRIYFISCVVLYVVIVLY